MLLLVLVQFNSFKCKFLITFILFLGGVITYVCSSSVASSPEQCMIDSSNSHSPASSPPLPTNQSRATDVPTARLLSKHAHPRGHASEKTALAAKSGITSKLNSNTSTPLLLTSANGFLDSRKKNEIVKRHQFSF